MKELPIKKILIVGGGTAGWMAAAAIAKGLPKGAYEVTLVESDEIGTVGVGEATIPQLQIFNRMLGVDEDDFVRSTKGTFKLGIEFVNWGGLGQSYFHAFGEFGKEMDGVDFYHWWLKMKKIDPSITVDDFTLTSLASKEKRFMRSVDAGNSPLSNIGYAYHFDAGLYARYLREIAEANGVGRTEGVVEDVELGAGGFIRSVVLASGEKIEADFFIDCSGFKGLLIEGALKTGFEDWSDLLPCNSAVTVASENTADPLPYTRSTAHEAGWQWRIPLQHRVGNGYVYCSDYISDEDAKKTLLDNIDGPPLGEPRVIRFTTGRRKKFWNKNCLALGLASGFMEPLESTSIHLVQYFLSKFFVFFPNKHFDEEDVNEFNAQAGYQFERIRDFLVLHYKVTERTDSAFWDYCREMNVPASLVKKIELFKKNGRIFRDNNELFNPESWFEVMYGQGLVPRSYHSLLDAFSDQVVEDKLKGIQSVVRECANHMPFHVDFISDNCKADD